MNTHRAEEVALDPLELLVRGRLERLAYCSYCPSLLMRQHPTLSETLCDALSQGALSAAASLESLGRLGETQAFHPHDPIRRAAPRAQRAELVRRLLREHQSRVERAARETGEPTQALRRLARVSLNPRVPAELWAELVLADLKGELNALQLDGSALLAGARERLLAPNQHKRWDEGWAHRRITDAMRRLHRVAFQAGGRFAEQYLQRLSTFDLPLFEGSRELYQAACAAPDHKSGDVHQGVVERCLGAYYQLADRQRHEVPWLVIAQHRRQLLDELNDLVDRWSRADRVIRGLFGGGELARALRRQATLDPELLNHLNQLASQPTDGGGLLDWVGRLELTELTERADDELKRSTERHIEKRSASSGPLAELSEVGLGDALARLLPSELSLLTGDERGQARGDLGCGAELELLFFQRYTEKRLRLYQPPERSTSSHPQPEREHTPTLAKRGPYVLCVDSSFSMTGERELLAKTLALQLAKRAAHEGRACHIITFSTDTVSLDVASLSNLGELVCFLAEGFRGGTDLSPALERAHELLREREGVYQGADVLVVSDFQLPELRSEVVAEQLRNQSSGVRYVAVLIGAQRSGDAFFTSCSSRYVLSEEGLRQLA